MADKEHLAILKQGVEMWNKWRIENQEIWPNLFNANLSVANLKGISGNCWKDWTCFISDWEVTNVWYKSVFSYLARTHNRIAEMSEKNITTILVR